MQSLLDVVDLILGLYTWIVIGSAIMSWLAAFNVINMRNDVVRMIADFLYRATEPLLRPIRRILPNLGGIDVSPTILLLGIFFLQSVIARYLRPIVF